MDSIPLCLCESIDGFGFQKSVGMIERTKCLKQSILALQQECDALEKLLYVNLLKDKMRVTRLLVQVLCVPDEHLYNIGTNALWVKRHVVSLELYAP